jgi:hypothetical protein
LRAHLSGTHACGDFDAGEHADELLGAAARIDVGTATTSNEKPLSAPPRRIAAIACGLLSSMPISTSPASSMKRSISARTISAVRCASACRRR